MRINEGDQMSGVGTFGAYSGSKPISGVHLEADDHNSVGNRRIGPN